MSHETPQAVARVLCSSQTSVFPKDVEYFLLLRKTTHCKSVRVAAIDDFISTQANSNSFSASVIRCQDFHCVVEGVSFHRMDTARIVSLQGESLKSSPLGEEQDTSADCHDRAPQRVPRKPKSQHSSALNTESQKEGSTQRQVRKRLSKILKIPGPKTKVETEKTNSTRSSARRRSKTLRFSAGSKTYEQGEVKSSSSNRQSASPNLDKFQKGGTTPAKRLGHRIPRSSSTVEAVAHETSLERPSVCRSSSEQEYSTQLLKAIRVSPRNNSRRWRDDAFPGNEQGEEGELDSIFRFIGECTRAVVNVLKDIPTIISELPRRTREAFERLLLLLKRPNVPLLEGPNNSREA